MVWEVAKQMKATLPYQSSNVGFRWIAHFTKRRGEIESNESELVKYKDLAEQSKATNPSVA